MKNSFLFICLVCCGISSVISIGIGPFKPGAVFGQGVNIGKTVVTNLLDYVPNKRDVIRLPITLLSGVPTDIISSIISELCSLVQEDPSVKPPEVPHFDKLQLVYMINDQNVSVPLNNLEALVNNSEFKKREKITILVTGWLTNLNATDNPTIDLIAEPYKDRDDINFIVFDSARNIDTLYSWASFQTKSLGEALGKAIAELSKHYSYEGFHLIGHSLGAHISSAAGRSFTNETGKKLPRITGLDPAKPCFREGEELQGLQRGDATFVDVIHTNPGGLGISNSIGDADFFPNGHKSIQSGCFTLVCSHSRSVELYAESTYKGQEDIYPSVKCNSLLALRTGRCIDSPIPMGYNVPLNASGNYYLETSGTPPYKFKK